MPDCDFYEFLNIDKNTFPLPNSSENRMIIKEILDQKFKEFGPQYHPDRGGDVEKFKTLIRAISVLGDDKLRYKYDGVDESEQLKSFFVIDWDKYFTFDPNSLAAEVGKELSSAIKIALSTDLFFSPSQEEDGYLWIFNQCYNGEKLTLSLVYDENDILSLSGKLENFNNALPFKIHIFYPDYKIKIIKNNNLTTCTYHDITLLSTTDLLVAKNYISQKLNKVVNGDILKETSYFTNTTDLLDCQSMNKKDFSVLSDIFKTKTFKPVSNTHGDDFLNNLTAKRINRITDKVIKVKK